MVSLPSVRILFAAITLLASQSVSAQDVPSGGDCVDAELVQNFWTGRNDAQVTLIADDSEVARAIVFMAENGDTMPVFPDAILLVELPGRAEASLIVGTGACFRAEATPDLVKKLKKAAKNERGELL